MISTSLSLPARYTTNGVFNGLDLKQAVVEVGIGTPNIMYKTTNTFEAGLPLKTDFFGDIGRSIGSAAYNFSSWISN